MKYTMIRLAFALLMGAVFGNPANAGFGIHGGSNGGSYGGSSGGAGYGSSGYGSSGYAVGYGSSGYAAGYGSSGGMSYAGYGSSGGGNLAAHGSSGGASSGGRQGLFSRLHTKIHSHMAAKRARHAGYGSSGYVAGGSSGGSSGGYAGYGSSGGYSGGYSGGSSGGSSGGYYSGYSSYGSSGGSVSYGSSGSVSYGSTGSAGYGSAGSVVVDPAYYGASKASLNTGAALVSNLQSGDDSVKLNVSVPEGAVVYVNDRVTTSTGAVRQFVSRGLEAGKSYRFDVRAEVSEDGKLVSDTQSVIVTAGGQENVRFAFTTAPKADENVDTAVVLNVPEGAEVTLAGNQTQVKGATRVFKTSQLKTGEVWDDYVIQVKVGDQVKTQSIRLIAGDKLELSFDFADNDASRLAAR